MNSDEDSSLSTSQNQEQTLGHKSLVIRDQYLPYKNVFTDMLPSFLSMRDAHIGRILVIKDRVDRLSLTI